MTVSTVSHPEHVATDAPGTTWSTGSTSITAGRIYLAFVDQYRTDSTNPDLPTCTLDGVAMSQVVDDLWDTDGSSRRRMTAFALAATSSSTGVATASAASAPAMGNIQLTEVTLDGTPNGPVTIQAASGDVSGPAGTLQEIGALSTLADSGNAIVAHVAANVDVSATARMELGSDAGGDADWFTGAITTNSSPTGCFVAGHILGDGDLTAGWYQNTGTPSAWMQAIEVSGATQPAAVGSPFWGWLLEAQLTIDATVAGLLGGWCPIGDPDYQDIPASLDVAVVPIQRGAWHTAWNTFTAGYLSTIDDFFKARGQKWVMLDVHSAGYLPSWWTVAGAAVGNVVDMGNGAGAVMAFDWWDPFYDADASESPTDMPVMSRNSGLAGQRDNPYMVLAENGLEHIVAELDSPTSACIGIAPSLMCGAWTEFGKFGVQAQLGATLSTSDPNQEAAWRNRQGFEGYDYSTSDRSTLTNGSALHSHGITAFRWATAVEAAWQLLGDLSVSNLTWFVGFFPNENFGGSGWEIMNYSTNGSVASLNQHIDGGYSTYLGLVENVGAANVALVSWSWSDYAGNVLPSRWVGENELFDVMMSVADANDLPVVLAAVLPSEGVASADDTVSEAVDLLRGEHANYTDVTGVTLPHPPVSAWFGPDYSGGDWDGSGSWDDLTSVSASKAELQASGDVAGMFVGATVDPRNGNTIEQEISAFEAALGVPKMDIIRRFDGSDPMPTSFYNAGNHGDDFQNDENVRHRAISVKGEPTQAELETFIPTIPDDGYTTWLIVHHEPENDIAEGKLTHDEAWFQTMLDNLHGAWIAVGAPAHVKPSLCLMTWLERDGNPATSSADWFPRSAIIGDFTLWLDPYDPNAIRTLEFLTAGTVDLWEAAGGGPWGIAETGTKRTGQDGADWITEGCAWARGRGAVGWCWFHSSVGNDGPWWLDDATMASALGAEVVGV